MKINQDKFKKRIEEAGADVEELGRAVAKSDSEKHVREGQRKVRNWLQGRNHPAARGADVQALARALGCEARDIATFVSEYKWSRSSPRKARLVVDLIRGRNVAEAKALLEFSPKRAAVFVNKALDAAISDAEHADCDIDELFISEARVDGGVIIKRFRPKDRGRAHPIEKRTSHIVIGVEEAN